MSPFARASWPADHRDEIVAGTLVAAVVVVLGYASGIGAPAPTTIDTASPPATETSAPPHQPTARSATGPPDTAAGNYGSVPAGGYWPGGSDSGIPVPGGMPSAGGEGGHDHGTGGSGGGPTTGPSPSPTPSPSPSDDCPEGEVRLVQPLLNGVATSVTGLLGGLLTPASPSPSPSPSSSSPTGTLSSLCVGIAASPSVIPEVLP
ncbi:hypothetical protein [Streptomyces guryensis]|uniref:Uncharacterized protein n=1 Tax=Streptomyces guryensis TaxID=2886947 RepID=A0A9Q3VH73_9ACTN|nr:hypothetical protein [Streptomyces guryensis]MCD9872928.1 hypothetical protein [Streptomyces guryensis]